MQLIGMIKRLHEGGPLTNRDPGGGSIGGRAPASADRHSATLGGIPTDNPDRAVLNRFVLSIGQIEIGCAETDRPVKTKAEFAISGQENRTFI